MTEDEYLLRQAERMRPLTEAELKARMVAQYPGMRNMTPEEIAAVVGDGGRNIARPSANTEAKP